MPVTSRSRAFVFDESLPSHARIERPTATGTAAAKDSGEMLDTRVRTDMESRFGHSFQAVRIHTDAAAADSARAIGAAAYTLGQDIAFAAGRYEPDTLRGQRLLAHELAHTVQQGDAPPAPTHPPALAPAHHAAEHQATDAAAEALHGGAVHLSPQPAMVMREKDMAEVVRNMQVELRTFFAYQDRFKVLNGREINDLLKVLETARAAGELQGLIDNFDAATGVDRPRLNAALQAAARKGAITHGEFAAQFASDLGGLPQDQQRAILAYLGAPAAEAPKAARAPRASTPAAPGAFKTTPYSMSTADVTLVRAREKKVSKGKGKEVVTPGRSEIKESPQHFTGEIVKKAGFDPPETWFNNFTSISFLGFTVSNIHTELAAHLKSVEQKFAEQYGGDQKDPAAAGKALGLKQNIGGGRHAPTGTAISMHLFGLAIDVNYDSNPWIVEESSAKAENTILARATLLVDGKESRFTPQKMTYDQIAALNQAVKTYFSYIDDRAALDARLKGATGEWAGKSADDAARQVQADFDALARHWERTDPKRKEAIKTGGFLDLQKAFVEGMGLDWGGAYGDMMHFDMRNRGIGIRIEKERLAYKNRKTAEAETKYAEEHPE